ncbi:MAG TPA: hypothetical protein VIH61_06375 [Waddliaceae bacterium]|jgi:hypothetical protein
MDEEEVKENTGLPIPEHVGEAIYLLQPRQKKRSLFRKTVFARHK